jgi:hypothetical protein
MVIAGKNTSKKNVLVKKLPEVERVFYQLTSKLL